MEVSTPFMLTADEYSDYSFQKSMQEYYRAKNAENFAKGGTEFDFLDMQFNVQALDKVFGPGGVRLKTSGSMSLTLSLVTNKIDNPALSESARKKTYFDFDEKIQATINASVGTKVGFNMTYNTDATFDFDAQKMSLKYEGDEDQIIHHGDRIAQLVFMPYEQVAFTEVDELDSTERGDGGFGHTGK